MSNVVGERYQITIDKKIRDQLGIEPGDRAVERIEDGRLVVTFVPKSHSRSLLGIFRRPRPPITDWQPSRIGRGPCGPLRSVEVLEADSRRHGGAASA